MVDGARLIFEYFGYVDVFETTDNLRKQFSVSHLLPLFFFLISSGDRLRSGVRSVGLCGSSWRKE